MGMLIYVILHRLCLVNEQNAMINLKNDIVKNIQKLNEKKSSSDFGLEKAGSLQNLSTLTRTYLITPLWCFTDQTVNCKEIVVALTSSSTNCFKQKKASNLYLHLNHIELFQNYIGNSKTSWILKLWW
jgi:hypothetical protein